MSKLKEIRKELGLSQKDVADKAGISVSYYSLLENIKRPIKLGHAIKISEALDRDVYEVFEDILEDKIQQSETDSSMIISLDPELINSMITETVTESDAKEFLIKVSDIIKKGLEENKSLEAIADIVAHSMLSFTAVILQELGMPLPGAGVN